MAPVKGAGGCLLMLVIFAAQLAALAGTVFLSYLLFAAPIAAALPSAEANFGEVVSIVLGLILACVPVFLLDRLCKRLTGNSILDNIPHLP